MKAATVASSAIFFLCSAALAETLTAPADTQKLLSQIPVTDKSFGYKNLAERLPNLGMTVQSIRVEKVAKGEEEPPVFKVGDVIITINTSEPNGAVRSICQIAGNPSYVRRGNKYIAQNRTAYWLMTNRCDFKG